jgi:aspartate 1-decarboxylase
MEEKHMNNKITVLKSKIHAATVTESDLAYTGSLTVDSSLLKAAGLYKYEKVQVVNINNGARFETYLIEGEADSGVICLNGACARLGEVGDKVIVMAYIDILEESISSYEPRILIMNESNRVLKEE